MAPADALAYVKPYVHYVSPLDGGKGVFRETADLILHSKGRLLPLIQTFIEKNDE